MKKKIVIERNIDMISIVQEIAKREKDSELRSWADGVSQALKWIIDNEDTRNVSTFKCSLLQEIEVMNEMKKMDWDD